MKAKIKKNGTMAITPTSEKEDLLLTSWYKKNKDGIVNIRILFNHFKSTNEN